MKILRVFVVNVVVVVFCRLSGKYPLAVFLRYLLQKIRRRRRGGLGVLRVFVLKTSSSGRPPARCVFVSLW